MALVYKRERNMGMFTMREDDVPSLDQFATAERRVAAKRAYLEDVKNELDLLERQAFNLYKSQVEYMRFSFIGIDLVSKWIDMLESGKDSEGNKLNKKKKYSEKTMYDFCVNTLSHFLGISDMKLTRIIEHGMQHEADSYEFSYLGHDWSIKIPVMTNVQFNSYMDIGSTVFMLELYHHEGCCREYVGSTFDEEELSDIMKSGIEKYVNGNPSET